MSLTANQEQAVSDHLKQNPETCQCGKNDWEYGDIQLPAAELVGNNQTVEPSREFVEIKCRKCGDAKTVDVERAGIPPV
jgi:predicted nucleic-acid-binding Zn-ribbon protein